MHISDGILDIRFTAAGFGVTAALAAYGLKKTGDRDIPSVAVIGAAFFAASLIHFKVGVTSVHLSLIGLTAILLGAPAVLAVLSGLFFQAVLFQHGGLTTLGINGAVMMIPALAGQRIFRILTVNRRHNAGFVAFTAGAVSAFTLVLASLLSALVLLLAGREFRGVAALFLFSNTVLAAVEGLLSALVIRRLLKNKPEMIRSWR